MACVLQVGVPDADVAGAYAFTLKYFKVQVGGQLQEAWQVPPAAQQLG